MKSINNHIEQEILKIKNPSLVEWFKTYAIKPKKIELIKNLETLETMSVWLLTDHKNDNHSNYRVVYNPKTNLFGLEMTMQDNQNWYMGDYGNKEETLSSL
jgi:hypothetical protein